MRKRSVADQLSALDKRLAIDTSLTDADREQIRQKAREHVAKKRRDKAEAEFLAKSIAEEERENAVDVNETYEDIQIDLAPFVASEKFSASFISLDGVMFYHGLIYPVRYGVAQTLRDIMARGWEHEREIHGQRRKGDITRQQLQQHIGPSGTVNSRSSLSQNTSI
jgi:hypothetical protein